VGCGERGGGGGGGGWWGCTVVIKWGVGICNLVNKRLVEIFLRIFLVVVFYLSWWDTGYSAIRRKKRRWMCKPGGKKREWHTLFVSTVTSGSCLIDELYSWCKETTHWNRHIRRVGGGRCPEYIATLSGSYEKLTDQWCASHDVPMVH